jgi:ABC-type transporter Mla maintaining outer membrane lipid asymmetry ATPase subunit MlaF
VTAVLDVSNLTKDYRGLRPLRIRQLSLAPGDHVAVVGLDQPAAETLVNLITGALLPDEGEVRIFGRSTAAIETAAEWLSIVDRFGILTERAVLLDPLSVVQNLAMPFSLDIEPPSEGLRLKAIALAREVELDEGQWDRPVSELDGTARARVRLGRALALDPDVVLMEHPTATVSRDSVAAFGRVIRAAAERRRAATLSLTADAEFAAAVATRVLNLDPASGRLAERRRGWLRKG